ncbi:putative zinc cluster transcription factor [Scheffersomyces amazonensis]|uniref:putative zinc cluster transcription factor n=1 Tax=Scheffersomyces amazonensis TaxID=1078765 RepID=UPI00315DD3DC
MNILASTFESKNDDKQSSPIKSEPLSPENFNIDSPEVHSGGRNKKNRVRTGCFCCRKRKKKCDEARPTCHACLRNRIKCVYPLNPEDSAPADFTLERANYNVIPPKKKRRRSSAKEAQVLKYDGSVPHEQVFNVIIASPSSAQYNSESITSEAELQNVIKISKESPREKEPTEESPNTALLELLEPRITEVDEQGNPTIFNDIIQSPMSDVSFLSHSKYISNQELSTQDSELFHHFVYEFMPSISLPHSHPLLSPDHLWVQLSSQSSILTDVYLCCGASYMSYFHNYTNGSLDLSSYYSELSEKKYSQAIYSLSKAFADKSIDLDSDWLLAAGLTLCLRDRAFGLNGSRCAKHLIFVYNLIKRRDYKKRAMNQDEESTFVITPIERSLVDSFLFNYSAALLSCSKRDLITLPSPYVLFPQIKKWLETPIFQDCDVAWMNNPVTGSALNSFEIMSKLAWLLRMHFEDEDDPELKDYYLPDEKYWELILALRQGIIDIENENRVNKLNLENLKLSSTNSYKRLRSNLAVSIINLNASGILLEKLINPIIPSFLPVIQDRVNTILEELTENIPAENHSSCLITLSLFITGISTINDIQRELLSEKLTESSNSMASNVGNNILEILKFGWEKETIDRINLGDKGYKCFDLIFDRPTIESITF